MNSPMTRPAAQKAAYFRDLSQGVVAGTHSATQVGVMAVGLTRASACNSIRYPSPSGWSARVPCGSPVFLSDLCFSFETNPLRKRKLADTGRGLAKGLSFPRRRVLNPNVAVHSRGKDQCVELRLRSLQASRRSRSRHAGTRWANRPSMVQAPARPLRPFLTGTLSPALSSGLGQTCFIAAKTRASATNLNSSARFGALTTETKPSAPLGRRWLFCCQMPAAIPAGQEPEGT